VLGYKGVCPCLSCRFVAVSAALNCKTNRSFDRLPVCWDCVLAVKLPLQQINWLGAVVAPASANLGRRTASFVSAWDRLTYSSTMDVNVHSVLVRQRSNQGKPLIEQV
jgi:hypothetical protein